MTRSRNAAPRLARAVRPAGPFRPGAFGSALHETRVASILSVALGVSFTICFLTGLASHWAQLAQPAIAWPAAPRDLYRWTQGAQVVSPLRLLAVLTPRRSDAGSQGVPVNKDARTAGVVERASDPAFRLQVVGAVARPLTLSLDDLRARASREADLPITCVEGWSVGARWRGVPVRPLRAALLVSGVVVLVSLPAFLGNGRATQPGNDSVLPNDYAASLATVLALVWVVILLPATIAAARRVNRPRRAR